MVTLVVACGGGGGQGGSDANVLTLRGVAATGKALPNATVSAKCKAGSGSTVTNAEGEYRLAIAGGIAPCIVQLVENAECVLNPDLKKSPVCVLQFGNPAQRMKLHSVASEAGALVNITPLTDMVTSRLLLKVPSTSYASFSAQGFAEKAHADKLSAAQDDVYKALGGTVDLCELADLIAAPLVAKSESSVGNPHGDLLYTLGTKLPMQAMSDFNWWLAQEFSTPGSLQAWMLAVTGNTQPTVECTKQLLN
jgi:hypothetical protein